MGRHQPDLSERLLGVAHALTEQTLVAGAETDDVEVRVVGERLQQQLQGALGRRDLGAAHGPAPIDHEHELRQDVLQFEVWHERQHRHARLPVIRRLFNADPGLVRGRNRDVEHEVAVELRRLQRHPRGTAGDVAANAVGLAEDGADWRRHLHVHLDIDAGSGSRDRRRLGRDRSRACGGVPRGHGGREQEPDGAITFHFEMRDVFDGDQYFGLRWEVAQPHLKHVGLVLVRE